MAVRIQSFQFPTRFLDLVDGQVVGRIEYNSRKQEWLPIKLTTGDIIYENVGNPGYFIGGDGNYTVVPFMQTLVDGSYRVTRVDSELSWTLSSDAPGTPLTYTPTTSDPDQLWNFLSVSPA